MAKRNKATFGSILIGVLTFCLLGFSVYNGLTRLLVVAHEGIIMTSFLIAGGLLGLFMGIKYPLFIETFSFAITILIAIQGWWDISYDIQNGINDGRVLAASSAVAIFLLNTFTGKLRVGTAKKVIKKELRA